MGRRLSEPADRPFAKWLSERVLSRGLLLKDIAAACGMSRTSLTGYWLGRTAPTRDNVIRIAAAVANETDGSDLINQALAAAGYTPLSEEDAPPAVRESAEPMMDEATRIALKELPAEEKAFCFQVIRLRARIQRQSKKSLQEDDIDPDSDLDIDLDPDVE